MALCSDNLVTTIPSASNIKSQSVFLRNALNGGSTLRDEGCGSFKRHMFYSRRDDRSSIWDFPAYILNHQGSKWPRKPRATSQAPTRTSGDVSATPSRKEGPRTFIIIFIIIPLSAHPLLYGNMKDSSAESKFEWQSSPRVVQDNGWVLQTNAALLAKGQRQRWVNTSNYSIREGIILLLIYNAKGYFNKQTLYPVYNTQSNL